MPGRRFSALETQLKSQSFSEISATYTAAPFLPRPFNGLFIPNQFGFPPPPPPLALFCVGDTLLCRELRLTSSQSFIYAVVSLSHSFSSCAHIVASTVAQWSALSPHSEKVAGSIPTGGLSDWGSECSSCAQIPKTCTLRQLVHGVTPPLTQDSWDMTLSAG